MKRILSIVMLAIVLAATVAIPSKAGEVSSIKKLLDEKGQLNATDWYDPNDELKISGRKLIIPNNSTAETRMISKIFVKADEMCEEMVGLSCDVHLTQLAKGEKFIMAMGLSSVEAYSGEAGNVEVEFTNKNGVSVGVTAYDKNGKAVQVAAPKSFAGNANSKFSVNIQISSKKQIVVKINNRKIVSGELPTSGEGRVGLLQTGNCGAQISNLQVKFTEYDRPENTDFAENFEKGIYNTNLFVLKFAAGTRIPAYLSVEEFEGSNVLRFKNAGLSYFGTKHQYSNFEITFDVPYFVRVPVLDENGDTLELPTMFGVSFGDLAREFADYEYGYAGSTDMVYFDSTQAISHNYTTDKFVVTYNDKGFFDNETNEGFSVQMRMVNGHYTLGMKSLSDDKFTTIAETDYSQRTGYVKIWTLGDGNVAIDNIQMKNLDDSPNLIDVPFKEAKIEVSDYEYKEEKMVFKTDVSNSEGAGIAAWKIISVCLIAGAVVVVAAGACTMVIMVQKKKKQTEVKENEKK